MHRALAIDNVEGLVGVVAVHVVGISGLRIDVEPSMKTVGVEDDFSFASSRAILAISMILTGMIPPRV
jgi:hypothetical protein